MIFTQKNLHFTVLSKFILIILLSCDSIVNYDNPKSASYLIRQSFYCPLSNNTNTVFGPILEIYPQYNKTVLNISNSLGRELNIMESSLAWLLLNHMTSPHLIRLDSLVKVLHLKAENDLVYKTTKLNNVIQYLVNQTSSRYIYELKRHLPKRFYFTQDFREKLLSSSEVLNNRDLFQRLFPNLNSGQYFTNPSNPINQLRVSKNHQGLQLDQLISCTSIPQKPIKNSKRSSLNINLLSTYSIKNESIHLLIASDNGKIQILENEFKFTGKLKDYDQFGKCFLSDPSKLYFFSLASIGQKQLLKQFSFKILNSNLPLTKLLDQPQSLTLENPKRKIVESFRVQNSQHNMEIPLYHIENFPPLLIYDKDQARFILDGRHYHPGFCQNL